MVINYTGTPRKVEVLPDDKMNAIRMFLKGAVYCWCNNVEDARKKQLWFAARDLVGGENTNWDQTPLQPLSEYYKGRYPDEQKAHDEAGKALGWILFGVLDSEEEKRRFMTRESFRARQYCWAEEQADSEEQPVQNPE